MPQNPRRYRTRIGLLLILICVTAWMWSIWRRTNGDAAVKPTQVAGPATNQHGLPPGEPSVPIVDPGPLARMNVPGIAAPELCQPEDVDLTDSAQVIGITVDGQDRAYVVESFAVHGAFHPRDLSIHVVNDVVAGRPVCVTHCNRTHVTRVLTDDSGPADAAHPIDLRVGGWSDGLLLLFEGNRYHQHASTIPLEDVVFVTTTWKEWYAEHPQTLVYTGEDCGG
jgi:hypothetical protein